MPTNALLDCLFVGLFRDYGRSDLDTSHEWRNLWTGLDEHRRLRARAFHPDAVAARHGVEGMRARFADLLERDPPALLVHHPFTPELDVPLDAVAALTRRGVPTVEFDADSSWRFDEFIRPRIGAYALFATTHAPSVARYRDAGANVHLTQWAVGSWYRGGDPDAPRDVPVSFVGRTHGGRRAVVRGMRRSGLRIDTWGPRWGRSPIARVLGRGRNHGYATFEAWTAAVAKSRVSLNLSESSRKGTGTQIKARHFEIPALGACPVSAPTEGIEDFYEPGEEIVLAEPGAEMADAVRALLRDDARRIAIARAAWRRTWAEHTWEKRIDALLGAVGGG